MLTATASIEETERRFYNYYYYDFFLIPKRPQNVQVRNIPTSQCSYHYYYYYYYAPTVRAWRIKTSTTLHNNVFLLHDVFKYFHGS